MATQITTNKFEVTTTEYKFGSSSLEFNGVDNTLIVTATNNEFNFNQGAFTAEGWINVQDPNKEQMIVTNTQSYGTDSDFYVKFLDSGEIETGLYGYDAILSTNGFLTEYLDVNNTIGNVYTVTDTISLDYVDDFTIEGFVKFNSLPSTGDLMMFASGGTDQYFGINNISGTYYLEYKLTDGTTSTLQRTSITTPATTSWYHFALVKNNTSPSIYWNGTRVHTTTTLNTYGWTDLQKLGHWTESSDYILDGKLDEIRLSSIARYSGSTYTVPTSPFISDDDTEYLNKFNVTPIIGNTWSHWALTRTYADSSQTTISKFGDSSFESDPALGASGIYEVPTNVNITLTDNFTAEGWVRFTSLPSGGDTYYFIQGATEKQDVGIFYDSLVSGNYRLLVQIADATADGTGTYYEKGVDIPTPSLNTWYHFAVIKTDTDIDCYWNGTKYTTGQTVGSFSTSLGWGSINKLASGYSPYPNHTTDDYFLDGYLDEIRISNIARYSGSTYTVPTSAFTTDANTLYLNHLEGYKYLKLFVDGVETIVIETDETDAINFDNLYFGHYGNTLTLDGYIDEVRISDTNRYTGNFTPSGTAFTTDSNTLKLIDFEDINNLNTQTSMSIDLSQLNLGLSPSTTYRIDIEEGFAKSLDSSRSLSQAVGNYATFTTNAADATFVSSTPTSGATGVTDGDTIVLNFDRYVRAGSTVANLYSVVGGTDTLVHSFDVGNTSQVTYTGNTATFITTGYISNNTTYRLDVPNTSIVDIDEFTISNLPVSITYTTGIIV